MMGCFLLRIRCIAAFMLIGFLINACAMVEKNTAMQMERTLHAAGFRMLRAGAEIQVAYLRGLPQRTLFTQQRHGEANYVYADADYCKCLYIGQESAYQHYQKLAGQQRLLEDKIAAAGPQEETPLDWDTVDNWTLRQ